MGPFDLQHSMDFTSSPFEAIMSRRHARAFVFSQRNLNRNGSRAGLKLKSRVASRIICVSDAVRDFMQGFASKSKLDRIHPGIEVDRVDWRAAPSKSRPGTFRLLMVGHIARLKRFEEGIRLRVAALAGEMPNLHLQIAGAGGGSHLL